MVTTLDPTTILDIMAVIAGGCWVTFGFLYLTTFGHLPIWVRTAVATCAGVTAYLCYTAPLPVWLVVGAFTVLLADSLPKWVKIARRARA